MSRPFFIVGCGRSGTSLLRGLLNRHPELAIPLESLFIADYLKASRYRTLAELIPMLLREPELREWGLDPSQEDLGAVSSIAEAIERLHQLYARAQEKRSWGQKTPRLVRHMPLILEHFPSAGFIHVVRDPRAVTSSLIRSDVHRSNALFGARRWRMDVAAGLAFERRHPERVLRIAYEELVRVQRRTLERACAFIGLESEGQWWKTAPGSEEYSAFYDQIHAGLDREPTDEFVDRWEADLTRREVELIESVVGELMDELGYQARTARRPITRIERWRYTWSRPLGLIRQAVKYLRYRPGYLFHLVWRKWRLALLKEWTWTVNY